MISACDRLFGLGMIWETRSGEHDGPLVHIDPKARVGKLPCGECHLHPGDTCCICGAEEPD